MLDRKLFAPYLAGFIDGEGCFGIYLTEGRKTRLTFSVGGKDEANMLEVQKMLHSLGIKTNWCQRADGVFMIQTESRPQLKKIATIIGPFIKGCKADQIRKQLEIIEEGNPEPARVTREVQRL